MSASDDRHGRFNVVWTEAGVPLDRWERDVEMVREHIAFVEELVGELRTLVTKCHDVLLGRETGPRFWSRFKANVQALERVAERDRMYVEVLEQLAAIEAEKRAR